MFVFFSFLFNDLFIISKEQTVYCFHYQDHFKLKGSQLKRLRISADGTKQVFAVDTPDSRSFVMSGNSDKKSSNWCKKVEDVLSKLNDKVFGTSLEDILLREQGEKRT